MSEPEGYRTTAAEALAGADVAGKTVIVTGGLSGIGLETTRAFRDAGASVVVAVRRPDACEEEGVQARALDLSDQASVRAFAAETSAVDILICNAGVMATPLTRTAPHGYEIQFATNHLGHFLLANLLAPQLLASTGRVVVVSSAGHKRLQASGQPINWGDVHFRETEYQPFTAYGQSKAANIMFAKEFSRRLAGTGVFAVSLHPGAIMTALQRHMDPAEIRERGWVDEDGNVSARFKTPAQGAATSCFGAVSPALSGGEYLVDCAVAAANDSTLSSGAPDAYAGMLAACGDEAQWARLWAESEAMVGQAFPAEALVMRTHGYVSAGVGQPFERVPLAFAPLRDDEVAVDVSHCGLCASDITIWRTAANHPVYKFPLCCGHEGVGVVARVGARVRHLAAGDRVGLGVLRGACGSCGQCLAGRDNLCAGREMMFGRGARGAFAERMHIKARYALKLPDAIASEEAGPLLCAGTTTFAPFVNHDVRPGDRVGVVGIGGLGHLAVQFARAWGCHVTAISSSRAKEEEVTRLGAHRFVATREDGGWESLAGSLDYVLATTSGAHVNWEALVAALRPNGRLIVMGIAMSQIPVSDLALINGQKIVCGSAAGSTAVATAMLDFAALHNVRPICETFPFSDVATAIEKVAGNQVRFRAVLVHGS